MSSTERTYKRYDTTPDLALENLQKFGISVIPNLISPEECARLRTEVYKNIKEMSLNHVDFEDRSTWPAFHEIFRPSHSMLMQGYSVGHIQPLWDIRQNDNVVNAFAKVWNSEPENMITSFDGMSLFLPIPNLPPSDSWLHVDQGIGKREFQCIQGIVNLYDVKPGDATLNVLESSHQYHDEYLQRARVDHEFDFVSIEDVGFYEQKGCESFYVEADAGSLILWDSRTVHQGAAPIKDGEDRFRIAIYVCMMPRDRATKEQLEERVEVFEEMYMTAHWPVPLNVFAKRLKSRQSSVEVKSPDPPKLTELGRRLVGYDK
ncbi:hypothetical protein HK098_005936 [Nowakowskiella sp. JEL0407]|nr:hypothetical protein HK098_005936 [Nowakowskiella sp. JEL0407]